ncbi:hypothetical protein GCM10010378_46050 [Streptomyces viridochromogenes]
MAVIGGGQSGLATAHELLRRGVRPVVLEASERAAGSWPRYYDSLTLFSPARYSSLPGMQFPGPDRDRYPHRDEVVAYLTAYACRLDADIRTGFCVSAVRRISDGFEVETEGGGRLSARAVVAASGSFGRPHRPVLPGLEEFTGQVLHAADYRSPAPLAGRRVVVVGAGNSAVQIAAELAQTARVTLATRAPVKFAAQRVLGRDDVGVSQPTVSHHLKKLKEAGLLTSERRGTWVYYRVEPSVLAAMGKLLAPAAA